MGDQSSGGSGTESQRQRQRECVLNGGQEQSEVSGSGSTRGREWRAAGIT